MFFNLFSEAEPLQQLWFGLRGCW